MPWQFADLDALGLTAAQCDDAVQWVDAAATAPPVAGRGDRRLPDRDRALLRSSRPVWRPPGACWAAAGTALAWPVYRWVARNRHRMPGGTAACALPHAPLVIASPGVAERLIGEPAVRRGHRGVATRPGGRVSSGRKLAIATMVRQRTRS